MPQNTLSHPETKHHPDLKYNYKVYPIDRDSPALPFLVGKYSSISLQAKVTNPEAFGVAYLTEAAWTPSQWTTRITRPEATTFVCVAHSVDLPEHEQDIFKGHWVAMVTMMGPTPKSVYWLPESGAPEPLEDDVESKWHHTATWVDPAHRGHHIATKLIDGSIVYAMDYSRRSGMRQLRMRMFTGPDNVASMTLYGRSGFEAVGKCTINEAMVGNGNEGIKFLGRDDWDQGFMNSRQGMLCEMVKIVDDA